MKTEIDNINLVGIALNIPTSNRNGQSGVDCGQLWQQFEKEAIFRILGKLDGNIYAVYHNYETDHTGNFNYFIGCRVGIGAEIPDGLTSLKIPKGWFYRMVAKGQLPTCVANMWQEIWNSDLSRAYNFDFEVFGEKSKDWNDAEVEIFIS